MTDFIRLESLLDTVCELLNVPFKAIGVEQWSISYSTLFPKLGLRPREYKLTRKMDQFDWCNHIPSIDRVLGQYGLKRQNVRVSVHSSGDGVSPLYDGDCLIVEIMIVFSDDSLNGNLFQSIGAMD